MARVIVGLPTASRGAMFDRAVALRAPVMISASALATWRDVGPVPPGHEFTALERSIRIASGDTRPPSDAQRRRRMREWTGWNLTALERLGAPVDDGEDGQPGHAMEIHIDSAGFVAMAVHGGHLWSCESYVLELAAAPQVTRFSSMDLCVEPELATNRTEVRERISKTINLNRTCSRLAREAGIHDRLMPVIQGWTAEDYLRCFDAISGCVSPGATIGLGSMCRRAMKGEDGAIAIIERLDRELPRDVRFHGFGMKSDAAEAAAAAFGDRIDTVDSQSHGVRARRMANDMRARNPHFSKTNAFCADVMEDWYVKQVQRMASPRPYTIQPSMAMTTHPAPRQVLDAIEIVVHAQFDDLIECGELAHDQIVAGRMLEESVMEMVGDLPRGVGATDRWTGRGQLPPGMEDESWFPAELSYSPS